MLIKECRFLVSCAAITRSAIMEQDATLLELARYVVLNRVGVRLARTPNGHGIVYSAPARPFKTPLWLTVDWLLAAFSEHRSKAIPGLSALVRVS